MHLINYDEDDDFYQVQAYLNPGESGYVYLKAFNGRGGIQILDDDYSKRKSIEYIGWSSDPQELFFYDTEADLGEALIAKTFPARMEIWFVPSKGGAERKLFEKYFTVK